jgi:solute carrier family 25 citrate transporter 1
MNKTLLKEQAGLTCLQSWIFLMETALISGCIAGAVEGLVTFPAEFVKTQLQLPNKFNGPIDCLRKTISQKGLVACYRGVVPLVIGNSAKAGVRFYSFEYYKQLLGSNAIAGLFSGVTEAVLVVTPSETIKTKLIHDQNSMNPRFKSTFHAVHTIVKEEGVRGIYKGLTAVVTRQAANSAVRLSTYGYLKDYFSANLPVDPKTGKTHLAWYSSFAIGASAGLVTVYCTMPFDVVKTRMQSLNCKYPNTLNCLVTVAKEEGLLALWKGATPRLGRLLVFLCLM